MRVRVVVFANLKEFFQPELELDLASGSAAGEVLHALGRLKPASRELLSSCRLAVDENFVDESFSLMGDHEVLVMPPSSGG